MTDRELMGQALDVLEDIFGKNKIDVGVINRLRDRLAQPEQEPVAWVGPSWLNPETRTWESESFAPGPINGWSPLYMTPRQWQGLTDEEREQVINANFGTGLWQMAKDIEAKLKEKNT